MAVFTELDWQRIANLAVDRAASADPQRAGQSDVHRGHADPGVHDLDHRRGAKEKQGGIQWRAIRCPDLTSFRKRVRYFDDETRDDKTQIDPSTSGRRSRRISVQRSIQHCGADRACSAAQTAASQIDAAVRIRLRPAAQRGHGPF